MKVPIGILRYAEEIAASDAINGVAICVDMDDIFRQAVACSRKNVKSAAPFDSSAIPLPPALGQCVGRVITKLYDAVKWLLDMKAKCVALVFGVTDSLEEVALLMQVYKHVMDLVASLSERCQVYVNRSGTALIGIQALLSNCPKNSVNNKKKCGLLPPWKRSLVCTSDPLGGFMGFNCIVNLLSLCHGKEPSIVKASKLVGKCKLDDAASLPVFALIASKKVSITDTTPYHMKKQDRKEIALPINSRKGLLSIELLKDVGLLPSEEYREEEARHLLFQLKAALADLRAECINPPELSTMTKHQYLLPILFHRMHHSTVRLGKRHMHDRFSRARSIIFHTLLTGRLARIIYEDSSCADSNRNDAAAAESQIIRCRVEDPNHIQYIKSPSTRVLKDVLKLKVGDSEEMTSAITAKELEDIRRIPEHLQLYAAALKILYRTGILTEMVCRAVCRAIVSVTHEKYDIYNDDMHHKNNRNDESIVDEEKNKRPSPQEIYNGLQELHVCWIYAALANDILHPSEIKPNLSPTPLVRYTDASKEKEKEEDEEDLKYLTSVLFV